MHPQSYSIFLLIATNGHMGKDAGKLYHISLQFYKCSALSYNDCGVTLLHPSLTLTI